MNWLCMVICMFLQNHCHFAKKILLKKYFASMFYLLPHCSHQLLGRSLGMSYTFHYLTSKCLSHRTQIKHQRKSKFPSLPSNLLSHCLQISLQRISGRFGYMQRPLVFHEFTMHSFKIVATLFTDLCKKNEKKIDDSFYLLPLCSQRLFGRRL